MPQPQTLRQSLIAAAGLLGSLAMGDAARAQATADPPPPPPPGDEAQAQMEELVVTGNRYNVEELSSTKFTKPLLDTAQTVNVVPDRLLQEQGRRTLRDALRNVAGISIQAGEGNPPNGDAFSIRGFTARDDIFLDGVRDVGNYFRDPFNTEQVEVLKGPASSIAGRGAVGGSVNIVSRLPKAETMGEAELSLGTDELFRATADVNVVADRDLGLAFRVTAMGHSAEEPGRDFVENERWGVAPSVSAGLGGDTVLTAAYFHMIQNEVPDLGLPNGRNRSLQGSPFAGRVAPVDRSFFYGHSTDFRDVTVDQGTLRLDHRFTDSLSLRSTVRYGRTFRAEVASAPRFVGPVTSLGETTRIVANQKPRRQRDTILAGQTDLRADLETGPLTHAIVAGIEVTREEARNRRQLDTDGPPTTLFDPQLRAAPFIPFNGTRAAVSNDAESGYIFDTIDITPRWIVSGGIRFDSVTTRAQGFDDSGRFPGFVTDVERTDNEFSGNASVVFKPTPDSSVYAGWANGFVSSGRFDVVNLAGSNNNPPATPGSFDVAPERNRSFEVGAKWEPFDGRLSLAASLFQIDKTNGRTPGEDPDDPPIVLEGEQRVRGVELNASGDLTERLSVYFGYTYLDSEVTESNLAFEVGQTLPFTPRHQLTSWASYAVTPDLSVGGGVQYQGERISNLGSVGPGTGNIPVTAPSYVVLDLFAEYRVNDWLSGRLNINNVTDSFYFQSFTSGQSIPAAARAAIFSVTAKF